MFRGGVVGIVTAVATIILISLLSNLNATAIQPAPVTLLTPPTAPNIFEPPPQQWQTPCGETKLQIAGKGLQGSAFDTVMIPASAENIQHQVVQVLSKLDRHGDVAPTVLLTPTGIFTSWVGEKSESFLAVISPTNQIGIGIDDEGTEFATGAVAYSWVKDDQRWASTGQLLQTYLHGNNALTDTHSVTITIPPLSYTTDVTVTFILFDVQGDGRRVDIMAQAGTGTPVNKTISHSNEGDFLAIEHLVLRNVVNETSSITAQVSSPNSPVGDSIVWGAVMAQHACAPSVYEYYFPFFPETYRVAIRTYIDPPIGQIGLPVTMTVEVANHETFTLTDLQVTQPFPASIMVHPLFSAQLVAPNSVETRDCTVEDEGFSCIISELSPGENVTFQYTLVGDSDELVPFRASLQVSERPFSLFWSTLNYRIHACNPWGQYGADPITATGPLLPGYEYCGQPTANYKSEWYYFHVLTPTSFTTELINPFVLIPPTTYSRQRVYLYDDQILPIGIPPDGSEIDKCCRGRSPERILPSRTYSMATGNIQLVPNLAGSSKYYLHVFTRDSAPRRFCFTVDYALPGFSGPNRPADCRRIVHGP